MPGGSGRLAIADIGSADRAAATARWRAGDLQEASTRRTGLDMHPESRDAGACRLSNFDAGVAAAAKTAPPAGPQERSARERGHPQRPDPCAGPQADNARPAARSATRCSARSTTASSGAWTTGTFPAGAVGGCVHDGARIPVNFRHAWAGHARDARMNGCPDAPTNGSGTGRGNPRKTPRPRPPGWHDHHRQERKSRHSLNECNRVLNRMPLGWHPPPPCTVWQGVFMFRRIIGFSGMAIKSVNLSGLCWFRAIIFPIAFFSVCLPHSAFPVMPLPFSRLPHRH